MLVAITVTATGMGNKPKRIVSFVEMKCHSSCRINFCFYLVLFIFLFSFSMQHTYTQQSWFNLLLFLFKWIVARPFPRHSIFLPSYSPVFPIFGLLFIFSLCKIFHSHFQTSSLFFLQVPPLFVFIIFAVHLFVRQMHVKICPKFFVHSLFDAIFLPFSI